MAFENDPVLTQQGAAVLWQYVQSLAALFGLGAIALYLVKFCSKWIKESLTQKGVIAEKETVATIDQDQNAFKSMEKRLDKLTERFDALQTQYADVMAKNATLTANNEHLQGDNERLRTRVTHLEALLKESTEIINKLSRELDILKLRFDGPPPIEVRVVDGEEPKK